jgi:predicted transcriptional regulator
MKNDRRTVTDLFTLKFEQISKDYNDIKEDFKEIKADLKKLINERK